jgi:Coenzyme PQQ synthesis protein D (PqqD)
MGRRASGGAYVVASPDIVSEEFEGEFVVLDLGSGTYYSMDTAASALWRAIVSGVSVDSLAAALEEAPGVNAQFIHEFAEKLVAYGCLTKSDAPGSAPADPATVAVLKVSARPPVVEVFDDLADLIKADPIHDVEETAGWPVRKPIAAE